MVSHGGCQKACSQHDSRLRPKHEIRSKSRQGMGSRIPDTPVRVLLLMLVVLGAQLALAQLNDTVGHAAGGKMNIREGLPKGQHAGHRDVKSHYIPMMKMQAQTPAYLNWGFGPVTEPICKRLQGTDRERCQLYAHVAKHAGSLAVDTSIHRGWDGKETLEVGCGRCSGSIMLAAEAQPKRHVRLGKNRTPVSTSTQTAQLAYVHSPPHNH